MRVGKRGSLSPFMIRIARDIWGICVALSAYSARASWSHTRLRGAREVVRLTSNSTIKTYVFLWLDNMNSITIDRHTDGNIRMIK